MSTVGMLSSRVGVASSIGPASMVADEGEERIGRMDQVNHVGGTISQQVMMLPLTRRQVTQ